MTDPTDLALTRHLAALPDPRVDRTKKHLLGDIFIITLCATIAGADSWQEVERFGRVKISWLRQFLKLPNGIPSHDTFRRLFARIDPKAFNRCMADWMAGLCEATGLRHVAIDGKVARQVSQLQSISAAVNTFKLRFNAIPGDFYAKAADFGLMPGVANAAGYRDDGQIEDGIGKSPIHLVFWEPIYFFSHLVQANLLPSRFVVGSSVSGHPCLDGTADPSMSPYGFYAMKLNPSFGMIAATINGAIWLDLSVWDCSGGTVGGGPSVINGTDPTAVNGVMTPAEAYSIDTKIDDGLPASGTVVARQYEYGGDLYGDVDHQAPQCVTDVTAMSYNVRDNRNWCKIIVKIQ